MKLHEIKLTAVAAAMSLSVAAPATMAGQNMPYEVWGADQSNSVAGTGARGVLGSYLWIWNSEDVRKQVKTGTPAQPIGCDGSNTPGDGPCDMLDVFPGSLTEVGLDGGATGETLGSLPGFGRLHGMLPDPQNLYQNINSFVPGGGYIGIVDGRTKEAVALFRVTQTSAASGGGRSNHMSFWSTDGSALYIANLHGRILERIDITRDADGNITNANFNASASLNVGKTNGILDEATAFTGTNAQGNALVSTISGDYATADMGLLTPNGFCREDGCGAGPDDGRPTNVIVCPIVSENGNVYITMGGGGLLVADGLSTPMSLVAEYDRGTVNGAGCGGIEDDRGYMWLNAGASAGGAGATQSTFTMYAIDDTAVAAGSPVDTPAPVEVYKDTDPVEVDGTSENTATIGNDSGPSEVTDGQLPGVTTRRDAHGAARTLDGRFVHNVDRLQNTVDVFQTSSQKRIGTYDLTSRDGQGKDVGPCYAASDPHVPDAYANDPAPDLMDTTPDGEYLVVALRGPIPVSVTHNAQGSCPGVGIIKLEKGGKSGKLAAVLRSYNSVDDSPASAPGGYAYTGDEHSDPHGASVRIRVEDLK